MKIYKLFAITLLLIASKSALAEDINTKTLSLPSMTCAMCPITIKKALTKIDGIKDVSVNFEDKKATVIYDADIVDLALILTTTGNVGYPSTVVDKKQ